jgi:acyl-coenzyme A thioesterase PaaI-like protein
MSRQFGWEDQSMPPLQRVAATLASIDPDHPDASRPRRRMAEAVRRLVEEVATTNADDETLGELAQLIEATGIRLAATRHDRQYLGVAEGSLAGAGSYLEYSPLVGPSNPLSTQTRVELVGDHVIATATFGAAYEGPPGCLHGGLVAAFFDDILGMTQGTKGRPGMTGRLTIHYRKPTPLYRPLRLEAWVSSQEGRKTVVRGTLHSGETLCAEGEGLFISLDPNKFTTLLADRSGEHREEGVAEP